MVALTGGLWRSESRPQLASAIRHSIANYARLIGTLWLTVSSLYVSWDIMSNTVTLISYRYPNKDKRYVLGGIIITRIEVVTVTRRKQLYIFMKHEDFVDHELYCVQRCIIVIREVS